MTMEEVLRALADGKIVKAVAKNDEYWTAYVGLKGGAVVYGGDPNNLNKENFSFSALYIYSIYEPPKAKKRYWQWKLNHWNWCKPSNYLDDNGFLSDGSKYIIDSEWNKLEKIKIEDDFIDVEQ